jgi:hypothetical protein
MVANKQALNQHMASKHRTGPAPKVQTNRSVGKMNATLNEPIESSGMPSNNALHDRLVRSGALGSTRNGSIWALRALHPCDEAITGGKGIPDRTSFPIATPEMRTTEVIAPPKAQPEGTSWDCIVIKPDIPEIAALVWKRSSAATEWVAGHLSVYPNPTYSIHPRQVGNDATRYRSTHSGMTTHLVAADLYNSGMVYASQFGVEKGIYQDTTDNVYEMGKLDPSSLLQRNPKTVVMPAKEGAYTPLRFDNPALDFAATDGQVANVTFPDSVDEDGGTSTTFTKIKRPSTPTADSDMLTTQSVMNWGVHYYAGIDSRASIQFKTVHGLEMVPTPSGGMSPFAATSPMLDQVALDAVVQFGQSMPSSYPAKDNDFGGFLKGLWNGIKKVARPILDVVGMIPHPIAQGISHVGGLVADGLGM